MSRKYDFGYKLEPGSTNEWAYNHISENSLVLELGSAVGNLTKHLKENKNCLVDIVEIDEESGTIAAEFARKALIGEVDGNLNTETWYLKLKEERYDYVVILDVLEHLDNPQRVLELLKNLLKDSGKIVTSIPNISNNAILVNLFNDKFEYTSLGLLDRTHRFFFTYQTILTMTRELNYNIDLIDAIMKEVGMSEISNSYDDVPEEVAYFLKKRELGDAYQFLLVLGKEEQDTENLLQHKVSVEPVLKSYVLFNGLSDDMLEFQGNKGKINIRFDIESAKNVSSIRFVPMEHACCVRNLKGIVSRVGERTEIQPNWTSGVTLCDGSIILGTGSQEINWQLDGDEESMEICCECEPLLQSMIPHFAASIDTINKIEEARKQNEALNEKYELLEQKHDELDRELKNIKETKWYKFFEKIQQMKRRG